jgi:hypothetical protein
MTEEQQVPESRQTVLTLSEAVLQMPDWAGMQAIHAQAMALVKQFKANDFAAMIGPQLTTDWAKQFKANDFAALIEPQLTTDWAKQFKANDFAALIEPRRSAPIHLPAMPAPEPTVQAVQSGEAEVLEQLDQMLHQGQIEPGRIAALLSKHTSKQPGPNTEGEFTKAKVLEMWAEWQSHSGNGEVFAAKRWNISKGYMYKLFKRNGLDSKRGH